MSTFAILVMYLGPALAKVLLKKYIGEPGAAGRLHCLVSCSSSLWRLSRTEGSAVGLRGC
ncbi:MAG: hypothetical protein COS85_03675 [Armatimonadetes bacterium CG07_land_8_20_14_0_80_59_28]|nr:MAG: hypothetical protein COS85_03675 [Armatimonadetes bacterium CG07_land_8_20_14_0_80_59_28]